MLSKLKEIVSDAYFQSAMVGVMVTLLVYFVWDSPITKYNIEVEPLEYNTRNSEVIWFAEDFNNDGTFERIRCSHGIQSNSLDIVHYSEEGNLIDHYHYSSSDWAIELRPMIFDINEDGWKDLLFFTFRNDSIFFNAVNLKSFETVVDHLFFKEFERQRDIYACSSEFITSTKLNQPGSKELFFTFDAGFGLYPRGLFKLNTKTWQFTSSSTEYIPISHVQTKDFNIDGKLEILVSSYSPCNVSNYNKFTDTMSYSLILDLNLNIVGDPLVYPFSYSSTITIPSSRNDDLYYRLVYNRSQNTEPIYLQCLNLRGDTISEKKWPNNVHSDTRNVSLKNINSTPYLFVSGVGHFILDPELRALPNKLKLSINEPSKVHKCIDLNGDGYDEWLYLSDKSDLVIYNEIAKESLVLEPPIKMSNLFSITPFFEKQTLSKYMIETGYGYFFISYLRNKLYFFVHIIYFGIFIFTTTLIVLVLHFQKRSIQKQWVTEKQLSELQFNSVKNQLNPHFLYNALNSVAYMILKGEKEEAYDFLSVNSRMIQRVMNDAKEVKRPLKDEIQFTKDYLRIQQHRFKDRFKVELEVAQEVDKGFLVPKMCIHTYVENAVKHGFKNTKSGGLLQISVSELQKGVLILVKDNGMGRKAASKYDEGSGNGINIMNEFYRLFEKYHGYKIDFSITDNFPLGTMVKLQIEDNDKGLVNSNSRFSYRKL